MTRMDGLGSAATAVVEWLAKTLRGPLAIFQFILAALVVFVLLSGLFIVVLAVRESNPFAFALAVFVFAIASVLAALFSFLAWRRTKLKIQELPNGPVDPDKEVRRRRLFAWTGIGSLSFIVLFTAPLVYLNLPVLARWYYEISFEMFPDPEVGRFQTLIRDLEQDRITDDALFTMVDELFILGPADPVLVSDTEAAGDLSRYQIDPGSANIGNQLFRAVRAGGLFFRPGSFAILTRDQDGLMIAGSRMPSAESASAWIASVRDVHGGVGQAGLTSPLLVFADHEGGIGSTMEQLSPLRVSYVSELPAPMAMSVGRSRANACIAGFIAGRDLRRLGVDVDLAPVLDIAANVSNQVVHDRSFSTDINVVTPMGLAYFDGMQMGGVAPVLKHFPGHSRTPAGAESGEGIKQSSLDPNLLDALLEPFRTVVAVRDAEFVMSANFSAPGLGLPEDTNIAHAPLFMTDLLRGSEAPESAGVGADRGEISVRDIRVRSLNFRGVLVSDDLLQRSYLFDSTERLTLAEFPARVADNAIALFDAGHDMLLIGEVRSTRPVTARFIASRARLASEEPAYATVAEVEQIRDLVRTHIFESGHPERIDRFRESLIRIFRAKLNVLHRRGRDAPSYQHSDSDSATGVAEAALTRVWRESFGYVFRGSTLNLTRPPSSTGGHILVTPMGSGTVSRPRRGARLTTAGEAGWLATSGAEALVARRYSSLSPVAMEFVRAWGGETRVLPIFSDRVWQDCRVRGRSAMGAVENVEVATAPPAGQPAEEATATGEDALRVPVSLELLSRSDTLSAPQTRFREPMEVRRQCLDSEGQAIAAAIAGEFAVNSQGRSIVFVVSDIKSYQAALFSLWHLRVLENQMGRPGFYLQRALLIFDWEILLTLLPNEFGTSDDEIVTAGDAEILKDVSMFFPFSGYQNRAERAVRFLTDSRNAPLLASRARTRLPMPVPGNEIPFSVSDAFDERTCAQILGEAELMRVTPGD